MARQLGDFCATLIRWKLLEFLCQKTPDLNHYFEVMNNRGEQLEKTRGIKARLMSVLNDIEDKDEREQSIDVLAKVWDANCTIWSVIFNTAL